jgi:hypothetical protein
VEREQWDRLLAEYATGGLSDTDKQRLFSAALTDQTLFDELMDEDALRELIDAPGSRQRLIDSLDERNLVSINERKLVSINERKLTAAAAMPAPPAKSPSPSPWLAWAAGIGVVFASGAITYMMFEGTTLRELAQSRTEAPRETKPFVAPPAPAKPRPPLVDEPPKIVAEQRAPALPTVALPVPLPASPPPALPEAPPAKESKRADLALPAANRTDRFQQEFRDREPQPALPAPRPQSLPAGISAGATGAAAAPGARTAKVELAKKPAPLPSVWRRTGDGVWTRIPAGEPVGRLDTLAIRYTPAQAAPVTLFDQARSALARSQGRAGEELEFPLPPALLEQARGNTLTLTIVEGTQPVPIQILLRQP